MSADDLTQKDVWDFVKPLFENTVSLGTHLAIVSNNAKSYMVKNWDIPEDRFHPREDGAWDLKTFSKGE